MMTLCACTLKPRERNQNQFCKDKTKLIQLPIDPAKCTVRGEGVKVNSS